VSGNKQRRFTNEFKREAVPMTSGPSVERVANDLGIAKSTLSRLRSEHEQADLLEGPHEDASKELARLRKENGILRPEREILKKAAFRSISRKGAKPPSGITRAG
jgi:transposase